MESQNANDLFKNPHEKPREVISKLDFHKFTIN